LNNRCGDIWDQRFKLDDGSIEEIKTKIPRLLPQKTINAIHKKAAANKTYTHGEIKNKYLLSRMIFCEHCGHPLTGQTSKVKKYDKEYPYYRHLSEKRVGKCSRPVKARNVNVQHIEEVVMGHLFECFGNPQRVQKAIQDATPNMEEVEKEYKRLDRIESELVKIKKGRDRVIKQIVDEKLTDEQAGGQLDKLNLRENNLTEEKHRLHESLSNQPDAKQISDISKEVSKRFKKKKKQPRKKVSARLWAMTSSANHDYDGMTWEEKRHLLEIVFSGKTPDGDRMGVWIAWDDKNKWRFSIKGHLINLELLYPHKNIFDLEQGGGGHQQDRLLTKCTSY